MSETADQLQLALEPREIVAAAMTAKLRLPAIEPNDTPKRRPIPDHIPRMEVELPPARTTAPCAAVISAGSARMRLWIGLE